MITNIKNFFLKNWIPKLACVLVATGLWFWVAIQQSGRAKFQVPIETINEPDDLFVSEDSTRQLTVTLQGPKTALYRTSSSDIVATLNLAGQTAGTKVFWRSDLSIQKPQNVQIYDVSPRNISITLVRRSEKIVSVQPQFSGTLPNGTNLRTTVMPDTAEIVGSSEVTQTIDSLPLKPINRGELELGEMTLSRQARLPEGVNLVFPATNSFNVALELYEIQITRTFESIPVSVQEVPGGMQAIVEPSNISLSVRGPKTTVESLQADDITVTVMAPPAEKGLVIRVPTVDLPEGVSMADGEQAVPPLKVKLESK
jgi:YbbR domain-containing protein